MAISDKNRKILWARSGARCAICRHLLIFDSTEKDSESVVGEECHIISGANKGPRSNSEYPRDEINAVENLLLLCRVHHKQIDDQVETYSPELLRALKSNHEKWVESQLSQDEKPTGVHRIQDNIPNKLFQITSGKQLLELSVNSNGCYKDYPEGLTADEIDLVGGFIQLVIDWGEIAGELGTSEKMKADKSVQEALDELISKGFLAFAAEEMQELISHNQIKSDFGVFHLTIAKKDDSAVIYE